MKKRIFTVLLVTCLVLLYAMPVGAQSLTSDGDVTAHLNDPPKMVHRATEKEDAIIAAFRHFNMV